jgi:hypothetical protein
MTELRKAARQALIVLEDMDSDDPELNQEWLGKKAIEALRAALAQPEPYPLPESLYPDSKDWVASDYWGRVELLHFMYESKRREVEQLEAAQPEQEPVAYQWLGTSVIRKRIPKTAEADAWQPLYTHPPKRKPLTEGEIRDMFYDSLDADQHVVFIDLVRAIEKAHGIGGEHE